MTNIGKSIRTCAACKENSEHVSMMSTSQDGADLDFRPRGMMRSTMPYWIQCCPSCGYCRGRIDDEPQCNASLIVNRPSYQSVLKEKSEIPELARHFLCAAEIAQAEVGRNDALIGVLVAAVWVMEDAKVPPVLLYPLYIRAAEVARHRFKDAIDKVGRALQAADLYRRAREFENADEALKSVKPDQDFKPLFEKEAALIEKKDSGHH